MRRIDRYEATLVLLTAVLVVLLIPFAAAFGTATHTRLQHQTQALRAGVHQIPACPVDRQENLVQAPPTDIPVPCVFHRHVRAGLVGSMLIGGHLQGVFGRPRPPVCRRGRGLCFGGWRA